MTCRDLDALRREHDAIGIGPELMRLLERVVKATAPGFPADVYARESKWTDQALEDVLQGWVEKRLVGRGDLGRMLVEAGSLRSLKGILSCSLKQYMINESGKGSAFRLVQRTKKLLYAKDGPFRSQPSPPTRKSRDLWFVGEAVVGPSCLNLSALVQIAHELDDDDLRVVHYAPDAQKASPILRKPQLLRFLEYLLTRSEGALTVPVIGKVLVQRFNLVPPQQEDLDTAARRASGGDSTAPQAMDAMMARNALARLSPTQRGVVKALEASSGDVKAPAAALGMSVEEVATVRGEVIRLVCEDAEDEDGCRALYKLVVETLFLLNDGPDSDR